MFLICRLIAAGILIAAPTLAWAQDAPGAQGGGSSLDAQLLEDLGSDLLEGLGDVSEGPAPPKSSSKTSPESLSDTQPAQPRKTPTPLDEGFLEQVEGEDIGAENTADDENPLIRIERKMRLVEKRLAQRDATAGTQNLQKQIAQELKSLIEQIQQQQQQQSQNQQNSRQQQQSASSSRQQNQQSNASSNPSNQAADKPAEDSEERLGKVDDEKIKPEDLRELFQRAWGHLPPRVREQMQAAAQEQFLPKYEMLIEEYFQRLAEQGQR